MHKCARPPPATPGG